MTKPEGWTAIAVLFVLFPAGAFIIRTCVVMLWNLWKGKSDEDQTDE